MGDDEIKQISHANLSNEDLKRRKLEEEIQREKEERQRKRQELMKKETEYEQVKTTWCVFFSMVNSTCEH